jgi:hypothetical protein
MSLIYGEGREKAFKRLREEIEKVSKGKLLYFKNRLLLSAKSLA